MGRVGSCFDNAVAEAAFSTIKVEYVHRRHFRTRTEARLKIATWITDFYNRRRRHSVCDWRPPSTTNDQRPAPWRPRPHNDALHDYRGLTGPALSSRPSSLSVITKYDRG
ncbi:integrase core domain-containing protein [Micromonospora sp. NPDC023814]|uniref:integrase core domain-containing protein n=1 Tax=Micromonospora sp. NPDC023814 TaxID=3154596 RepID=UPI0033D52612